MGILVFPWTVCIPSAKLSEVHLTKNSPMVKFFTYFMVCLVSLLNVKKKLCDHSWAHQLVWDILSNFNCIKLLKFRPQQMSYTWEVPGHVDNVAGVMNVTLSDMFAEKWSTTLHATQ